MDSRSALQQNMLLKMCNGERFTIIKEIARGGLCIVYDAFYVDNVGEKKPVRIKECYPFNSNIKRREDQSLVIPESEKQLFKESTEKVIKAYKTGSTLFRLKEMTNATVNTYNIYHANNTVYVVSAYVRGEELTYETYSSVRESISIVKTVAEVIGKMHNIGYLYLDIKPSNIFTIEGTTDLVQLFDFDTMVAISDLGKQNGVNNKISFTKGFAPVEQQVGDYRRIGRYSDVYGIGALLFYMIFNRVPDVFDCEANAVYDFTKSKLSEDKYSDKLTMRMTEFFHKTLACYYMDRYSNMDMAVEKLAEMVKLADTTSRFIYSSKVTRPSYFVGRKKEFQWISKRFYRECALFAVLGMGGIGKSTLVRECIKQNETLFNTIVYLNYSETITKTIANDTFLRINGVSKEPSESFEDYFERKINVMCEISVNCKNIIVIDNYIAGASEELEKLRQLNWTIVLVTRESRIPVDCEILEVSNLEDKQDLLKLFEENIGRELLKGELPYASHIFECVACHTLLIEMIAKQISSPVRELSLKDVCDLTDRYGFSNISPDKIQYNKDDIVYQDTVKQVLQKLFTYSKISDNCRSILRIVVLFGDDGIEITKLCECLNIESRDDIITLFQDGWIYIDNANITTHPVVAEAVLDWKINDAEKKAIMTVLRFLMSRLRGDDLNKEYQKFDLKDKTYKHWLKGKASNRVFTRNNHQKEEKISALEIYNQRVKAMDNITQLEVIKRHLKTAINFSNGCFRCKEIRVYSEYQEFLFYTIKNVSYENDDYIRKMGEEFIYTSDNHDHIRLLQVADKLLGVYYDYKQLDHVRECIGFIKKSIDGDKDPYVQALYYNILSGYFDELLDGHYEPQTEEELQLLKGMMEATNKSIRYIRKSNEEDADIMLAELYRLKALLGIRSGYGKRREIAVLLGNIQKLIEKYSQQNTKMERDFYMACAWYHTYVNVDHNKVVKYLKNAFTVTNMICKSNQERIEEYLSPAANILLECRKYDKAEKCLLHAIMLCEKQLDIITYRRLWLDLMSFLLFVYYRAEEYGFCKIVIELIDYNIDARENIEDYIPSWIREDVYTEKSNETGLI